MFVWHQSFLHMSNEIIINMSQRFKLMATGLLVYLLDATWMSCETFHLTRKNPFARTQLPDILTRSRQWIKKHMRNGTAQSNTVDSSGTNEPSEFLNTEEGFWLLSHNTQHCKTEVIMFHIMNHQTPNVKQDLVKWQLDFVCVQLKILGWVEKLFNLTRKKSRCQDSASRYLHM